MPSVTIKSGASQDTVTLENGDLRELIAVAREENLLNIPEGATVLVNGAEAAEDTVLEEGDEVVFGKAAGEKGV